MDESKYKNAEFDARLEALENQPDPPVPDYVQLTLSLCPTNSAKCGWTGWLLEAAFRRCPEALKTSTGDELMSAITNQTCPRCGETVYRSSVTKTFVPTSN